MNLRDFNQNDLNEYIAMSRDFFSGGAALYTPTDENYEKTFELCIQKSPFTRGLIIEEAGKIAGYCMLSFSWSNECGSMVLWIEELYIKEAFRCHKLGRQVLLFLEKEYPDINRIRLEVCHSNKGAIKLYEQMGYKFLDYGQMIKE